MAKNFKTVTIMTVLIALIANTACVKRNNFGERKAARASQRPAPIFFIRTEYPIMDSHLKKMIACNFGAGYCSILSENKTNKGWTPQRSAQQQIKGGIK